MDFASEIVEKISTHKSSNNIPEEIVHKIEAVLTEVMDQVSDIDGMLVTSIDGLPWAKKLPENFNIKRFSAMSSALLALSTTLAKEAGTGKTRNVMIEGNSGNAYVLSAGPMLLLTVFTKNTSNMGLTLAHTRRTAEKVTKLKLEHDASL